MKKLCGFKEMCFESDRKAGFLGRKICKHHARIGNDEFCALKHKEVESYYSEKEREYLLDG